MIEKKKIICNRTARVFFFLQIPSVFEIFEIFTNFKISEIGKKKG